MIPQRSLNILRLILAALFLLGGPDLHAQGSKTIADFPELTTPAAGDLLPIYDVSADSPRTRQISFANFSIAVTPSWANITSKPTTISGYGITDGVTLTGSQALTNKTINGLTLTSSAGGVITITPGKTLTVSQNITLTTDGTGTRTLNVGAGGTLGTDAYLAKALVASGLVAGEEVDNTPMLQAWIDAASDTDHKTLIIPAGTWHFAGTLYVYPGMTIRGQAAGDIGGYQPWQTPEGVEIVPFKTKLIFMGDDDAMAMWVPQCATNQFYDFELKNAGDSTGNGLVIANATYATASLDSTTTVTLLDDTTIPIVVGMTVFGTGIPNDTTVTAVAGTTVTISHAATVTGTRTLLDPLTFIHPDYPDGTNYATFAGNQGLISRVYIHGFTMNLAAHFVSLRVTDSAIQNAIRTNVHLERIVDTDFANCWVGGHEVDAIATNTEADLINIVSSYNGVRFNGGEFFQSEVPFHLYNATMEINGTNSEHVTGDVHFELYGGNLIVRNSRFALAANTASTLAHLHENGSVFVDNVSLDRGLVTSALTGTVTTNGTTAVVGTSTRFTKELYVGAAVTIAGVPRRVVAITDDTHYTAEFTHSAGSGQAASISAPVAVKTYAASGNADAMDRVRFVRNPNEFRVQSVTSDFATVNQTRRGGMSGADITFGDIETNGGAITAGQISSYSDFPRLMLKGTDGNTKLSLGLDTVTSYPSLRSDGSNLVINGKSGSSLMLARDTASDILVQGQMKLGSAIGIAWANVTDPFFATLDSGVGRRSGGGVEFNNGTNGTLVAGFMSALVQPSETTPASASAAGVKGTIVWDANYIYVCTATNTWKRVAISTW